jgi:hypothetical protein
LLKDIVENVSQIVVINIFVGEGVIFFWIDRYFFLWSYDFESPLVCAGNVML